MKTLKKWMIAAVLVGGVGIAAAQEETSLLGIIKSEDKAAIEALVLYPAETRAAILEATLHPELLIRIRGIQSETRTKFETILEPHSQETQAILWDLTRYPGLVDQLAALDRYSRSDADRILEAHPKIIHERAKLALERFYQELRQISSIQQTSKAAFKTLLSTYNKATQNAYRTLLDLPEILSIMTENIDLVVLTGDLYRRDPALLQQKADSLHLVVARQQAQELTDWKQEVENNSAIQKDLAAASDEFSAAHDYEYDDLYYNYEGDDLYYDARAEPDIVIREYHYYHYPYWFGYPRWYVYPRWRPYPHWWEWGFYMEPSQRIVILDLPSYYFINWYFYYPHHHYYYPRVTDHFIRHYRYHPRSNSSITVGVQTWQQQNREIITNNWIEQEQDRVERIRDFGRFEWERRRYNESRQPDAELSQSDFFERNTRRYPTIEAEPRTRTTTPPTRERGETETSGKSDITLPKTERKRTETNERIPPPPTTRSKRYEDLQKAKELHERKWEPQIKISPRTRTTVPEKLKKTPKKTLPRSSRKSGNNN